MRKDTNYGQEGWKNMTRELREFFKTPTSCIAVSLFLLLCGLRFYAAALNFMEISSYYPQLPYGSTTVAPEGDVYEMMFAPFYRFVGMLLVITVPVISSYVGIDRLHNTDKMELLGTGVTEHRYIFRKIYSSVLIFSCILVPVVLFPLVLAFFIDLNYVNMLTSFTALFCVSCISCSLSMPLGVLKFPVPVTIFVNICVQLPLYLYFFEQKFISFFTGEMGLQGLLWTLFSVIFSVLLSQKLYKATGIFA
jgi:hypothetical protein